MNIGRLDKRITIQNRVNTVDAWNHPAVSYNTLGTFWASVNFRSGRETQSAQQRVNVDRVFFSIRPNRNVSVTDRFITEGGTELVASWPTARVSRTDGTNSTFRVYNAHTV